jgi:hypothetical protein
MVEEKQLLSLVPVYPLVPLTAQLQMIQNGSLATWLQLLASHKVWFGYPIYLKLVCSSVCQSACDYIITIYSSYVLENKDIQALLCLNQGQQLLKPTQLLTKMKLFRVRMPFGVSRKRNTRCTINWSTDKKKYD